MEEEIKIKDFKFKVIKQLGKGGFGKVFQVIKILDNKCYALKVIPIKGESQEKIRLIENESDILSKFNCDNIVKYYDSDIDNNNFYILMEFCKGENLENFINKNKNKNTLIEEKILFKIIKQICLGIKEIHSKKIVHRDLKPENIFINENMDIKIGDFGISKQLNLDRTHLSTKNQAGSLYYIAPEIFKGIYNEKSDIWSLGCIIYELFNLDIYYVNERLKEVKNINSFYNSKWQELIDSLLQINYKMRFDIFQVNNYLEEIKININNEVDKIENNIKIMNINYKNKNIIIGEIYINENNINKDIKIINSYENVQRENPFFNSAESIYNNEKEIKRHILIKINEKKIKFAYCYKFNEKGKYIIEYSFKKCLTNTIFMFRDCKSLINLNLSNFDTQKINNMNGMFWGCESLKNINLSNFDTKNVTDMENMFLDCQSLINLNLSNFDTENVTEMNGMFHNCKSLINLDLSNFNTKNITEMRVMFWGCESLINLNISNFDTQNVTDMFGMFSSCKSLINLNLSSFNTKKVTNMNCMFAHCESLTNLNLTNFDTKNVKDMGYMFRRCKSLKKENIITKDDKILRQSVL